MTLAELLQVVKDENLTKQQLESLRDDMAHLYSLMQLETAKIKKEKAFFWMANKKEKVTNTEVDRQWDVTDSGQREIQLKYECLALKEELSSIKHRLYNIY